MFGQYLLGWFIIFAKRHGFKPSRSFKAEGEPPDTREQVENLVLHASISTPSWVSIQTVAPQDSGLSGLYITLEGPGMTTSLA